MNVKSGKIIDCGGTRRLSLSFASTLYSRAFIEERGNVNAFEQRLSWFCFEVSPLGLLSCWGDEVVTLVSLVAHDTDIGLLHLH